MPVRSFPPVQWNTAGRPSRSAKASEELPEGRPGMGQHPPVQPPQELLPVAPVDQRGRWRGRVDRLPPAEDREQDRRDGVGMCGRFDVAPQVVDGVDAEPLVGGSVLVREAMEGVGPEEPSPSGVGTRGRGVAAQIPEVGDPFEGHAPFGHHQRRARAPRCHRDVDPLLRQPGEHDSALPGQDGAVVLVVDGLGRRAEGDVELEGTGVAHRGIEVPGELQIAAGEALEAGVQDGGGHGGERTADIG